MELQSYQSKNPILQKISVDRKTSPNTLSENLKIAAISGVIDVTVCLEAANFIDWIIKESEKLKIQHFNFEQTDAEIYHIIKVVLGITRKSHHKMLFYLIKNAGQIISSKDICRECGVSQNTFNVQLSHLRSDLKKIEALNLLKTVRANSHCNESGYIIMIDELKKLKEKHQIVN